MRVKRRALRKALFSTVLTGFFFLSFQASLPAPGAAPERQILGPASLAASFALPEPQKKGGRAIFDALSSRASGGQSDFPTGDIPPHELSTILWAASGLNRPGKGWTVPMAMGRQPYCKIYVLGGDGAFLYDWEKHALLTVSGENVKAKISGQAFAAKAPYVLLFAADGSALASFNTPRAAGWGETLVGAMTQNVYLAADSLGIGARYMASFNERAAREALKIDERDSLICIMPLGKR